MQNFVTNREEAEAFIITHQAGRPVAPALVRQYPRGHDMLLVEVTAPAGFVSNSHAHDHESICYLVSGRIETEIDGVLYRVAPGGVFRHPAHVAHRQIVIEAAVWIEIKSPAPGRRDAAGNWVSD